MKTRTFKWIAAVMACFSSMSSLSAYEDEKDELIDLERKFYVKAEQIAFSDNRIYIAVESFLYETPAILADEDGYYIEKVAKKKGPCTWYQWQCSDPNCGKCNLKGIDWKCKTCGRLIWP